RTHAPRDLQRRSASYVGADHSSRRRIARTDEWPKRTGGPCGYPRDPVSRWESAKYNVCPVRGIALQGLLRKGVYPRRHAWLRHSMVHTPEVGCILRLDAEKRLEGPLARGEPDLHHFIADDSCKTHDQPHPDRLDRQLRPGPDGQTQYGHCPVPPPPIRERQRRLPQADSPPSACTRGHRPQAARAVPRWACRLLRGGHTVLASEVG